MINHLRGLSLQLIGHMSQVSRYLSSTLARICRCRKPTLKFLIPNLYHELQVFISYGQKSNGELLLSYGFVPREGTNPSDSVELSLSIKKSDKCYKEKVEALKKHGLSSWVFHHLLFLIWLQILMPTFHQFNFPCFRSTGQFLFIAWPNYLHGFMKFKRRRRLLKKKVYLGMTALCSSAFPFSVIFAW